MHASRDSWVSTARRALSAAGGVIQRPDRLPNGEGGALEELEELEELDEGEEERVGYNVLRRGC